MLDYFICGLEPIIGHGVHGKIPKIFEEACVLAERISQLANLVGGGSTCSKWHGPPNYTPIELDSMGAWGTVANWAKVLEINKTINLV